MRADRDNRRVDDVTCELLLQLRHLYDVDTFLAIDDNPTAIALWRSLDIATARAPGWDEPIHDRPLDRITPPRYPPQS